MPSKNPQTGHRLSGGAQRKLAALRRGEASTALTLPDEVEVDAFVGVTPPPVADGVNRVSSWAAQVLGVAVGHLATTIDAKAVLVAKALKSLGKMQGKAVKSENALKLRQLRQGVSYDLTATERPSDDLATHAWSFCRLAGVIYDVACDPCFDAERAQRFGFLVAALACFDTFSNDAALAALKADIKAES